LNVSKLFEMEPDVNSKAIHNSNE